MQRVCSSVAWGISPGASGTGFPRSHQTWVLRAPHDTAEPRPRPGPQARPPKFRPCCFPPYEPVVLGPSEEHGEDRRRRQCLRRVSKSHKTKSSTLINHTATAPRTLQPSARAHATFLARLLVPPFYWLIYILAAMIGLTSFLTGLGLTGRAGQECTSAFRHPWLLRALGLEATGESEPRRGVRTQRFGQLQDLD